MTFSTALSARAAICGLALLTLQACGEISKDATPDLAPPAQETDTAALPRSPDCAPYKAAFKPLPIRRLTNDEIYEYIDKDPDRSTGFIAYFNYGDNIFVVDSNFDIDGDGEQDQLFIRDSFPSSNSRRGQENEHDLLEAQDIAEQADQQQLPQSALDEPRLLARSHILQ